MANTKHLLDILGMSTITVLVAEGNAQKKFVIHQDLICARSDFFRNSMKDGWKESNEGVVELPEDDPQIFGLYVQSLYVGHVSQGEKADSHPEYYVVLGDAFELAQKLLDVQARNMVIQAIFDKIKDSIHPQGCFPSSEISVMINTIWEVASPKSPVRQLLIDIFVFYRMAYYSNSIKESSVLLDCLKELPADFTSELSLALMIRNDVSRFGTRKFEVQNYIEEVTK